MRLNNLLPSLLMRKYIKKVYEIKQDDKNQRRDKINSRRRGYFS